MQQLGNESVRVYATGSNTKENKNSWSDWLGNWKKPQSCKGSGKGRVRAVAASGLRRHVV